MIAKDANEIAVVVTLLSAVFAILHLFLLRQKRRPAIQCKANVKVGMPLYAELAVQKAKSENKVQLDYTAQSLDVVDDVLMSAHRRYSAGELDDGKVRAMAYFFGAYVGEVACRVAGASWDQESMSRPIVEVAFRTQHGRCMPVTWCVSRIKNGPMDSVSGKFRLFVLDDQGKLAELRANTPPKDGWA